MATVRLYLDRRAVKDGSAPAPLKLGISDQGSTVYIGLNVRVLPSQWDAKTEKVTARPDKASINTYIFAMKARAMGLLTRLNLSGLTPTQIKDRVKEKLEL